MPHGMAQCLSTCVINDVSSILPLIKMSCVNFKLNNTFNKDCIKDQDGGTLTI